MSRSRSNLKDTKFPGGEKSSLIVSSHYHYNSSCTLALNCMQSGHIEHIMIFKK